MHISPVDYDNSVQLTPLTDYHKRYRATPKRTEKKPLNDGLTARERMRRGVRSQEEGSNANS
jgi:hypothetical protein